MKNYTIEDINYFDKQINEYYVVPKFVKDLENSAINKLRKYPEEEQKADSQEELEGEDFENLYKGEVSKSGVAVLPSKRTRNITNKVEKNQPNKKPEIKSSEDSIKDSDTENKLEKTE